MSSEKHLRQGFLGSEAPSIFGSTPVGIVGLGGGGSHVTQLLAHIGFRNFVLVDPDVVEEANLNRLVGATVADVSKRTPKIEIARRTILGLEPGAAISAHQATWQKVADLLKTVHILFGCVDGYAERHQLEAHCRLFSIPYIDIGMDVLKVGKEPPRMAGQVILSAPGGPCMWCLGFLTQEKLKREAERYGDAGNHPQVVWPNAILAATAVGIAVDLLTHWTGNAKFTTYFSLEGNLGTVTPSVRLEYAPSTCVHYPVSDAGQAGWRRV